MTSCPLPPELAELVQRVASHPHGLGFLHQAYIDSVAISLGVHPFVVDAARAYLETPGGRAELIGKVREEYDRQRQASSPATQARPETPCPSCIGDVETLIQAAGEHPGGVQQLADASPEQLANSFNVHPYLIFRARGVLERRRLFTPMRS